MNSLKKIINTALLVLTPALVMSFAFAPAAGAQTTESSKQAICKGINLTGGGSGSDGSCTDAKPDAVSGVIKLAVNLLSFLVGIAAIVMIMLGGLKYVTSGGDSANTASAKNTILYAVVGLVIVALAQFIVRFILTRVGKSV